MNKLCYTVVAVVGCLTSTSQAADLALPRSNAPSAPIFVQNSWTGLYLGASVSYLDGKTPIRDCVGLCDFNHSVRKVYGAVNAGYDHQFANNIVAGVFAWMAVTPMSDTDVLAPGVEVKGKVHFGGFLGARLGYAMGNFMPYVFAGAQTFSGRVTIAVAPNPINRRTHTGYGLGVGAEYRLTQNWSLDARYMYSDLGFQRYDFGGGATRGGYNAHTVSLGVNYRF